MPTKQLDDEIFWNEEWWESEHVLDATRYTCIIMDTKDQKYDLSKIAS